MEYRYKTLSERRDQYPAGPEFVDDSFSIPPPPQKNIDDVYETNGPTSVKVTGKYRDNFLFVSTEQLDDINVLELNVPEQPQGPTPLSFRFIVEFVNGDGSFDRWTSKGFYEDLVTAKNEDNPYFTISRVTVVRLNFAQLSQYWRNPEFILKQNYAEVEITDTINTKEDMLIHINWMVSSNEELRPVKGGIDPFGDWILKTTDQFGFQFSDQVDEVDNNRGRSNLDFTGEPRGDTNVTVIDNDEPRSNQDFDGAPRGDTNTTVRTEDIVVTADTRSGDTTTRSTTTNVSTRTSGPIGVRTSSIGQQWYPFNSGGSYIGETRRSSDGTLFVWTGQVWERV